MIVAKPVALLTSLPWFLLLLLDCPFYVEAGVSLVGGTVIDGHPSKMETISKHNFNSLAYVQGALAGYRPHDDIVNCADIQESNSKGQKRFISEKCSSCWCNFRKGAALSFKDFQGIYLATGCIMASFEMTINQTPLKAISCLEKLGTQVVLRGARATSPLLAMDSTIWEVSSRPFLVLRTLFLKLYTTDSCNTGAQAEQSIEIDLNQKSNRLFKLCANSPILLDSIILGPILEEVVHWLLLLQWISKGVHAISRRCWCSSWFPRNGGHSNKKNRATNQRSASKLLVFVSNLIFATAHFNVHALLRLLAY